MRRDNLADLTMFLAVVESGSFTGAARRLSLTQSALSHTVRRLETRLGLRLLARSTRGISLTEAGEQLLQVLQPAIESVDERLLHLQQLSERPTGTIRITTSEHAAETLLWPAIDRLTTAYPDITFELNIENGMVEIVGERFDAGVRLGEQVAKDMIAVRISPDMEMAAVASPAYLASHGTPQEPQDLAHHRCINLRFTSDGPVYAWEFEKDDQDIKVRVDGQWILNRASLVRRSALAGHGIAYLIEESVRPLLESGQLVRVLRQWCKPFAGYYLYYPSRRQASPAFRLLVEELLAGRESAPR